jgi:hypothetical protein
MSGRRAVRGTVSFRFTGHPRPDVAGLVYRLAYNGDVVTFKTGRRLGKRVGGSAYRRNGGWGNKTAFRHGYIDQEVSTTLTSRLRIFLTRPRMLIILLSSYYLRNACEPDARELRLAARP